MNLVFPPIDVVRAEVIKVTNRETKGFVSGVGPSGDAVGWALHTLAEHMRAFTIGITPDESLWPDDYKQVIEDMEKIADDYDLNKYGGSSAPQYPYG